MTYNFRACDRDQAFLLPPDLRDWPPANHLTWFVLDVVDQLDLGPAGRAAVCLLHRGPLLPPDRAALPRRHRLPGPFRQQHA